MQIDGVTTIISIIFVFGVLTYWVGSFLIFYHLVRFGVGPGPKKLSAVYLGGSLVLSLVAVLLFSQIIK